ncbi:uncharacterized protein B0P05DRAFT_488814 [Gilbertella persicaria]|uniref:uncharacterized protein n=1 Tax=Gilbertella persicaria TaxID=101096 RepID=UPI00221F6CC1|nr:uncharacterized protein B0P05DRAFT_488814 [Gilbertella persicaria]KAI8083236.1 hypothetical protein B0P05DRAFT_488814 [Gilbertella persicaria]
MSFSCVELNCTGTFRTQAQLNKHKYDHHTLQITVTIQNTSYTTDKTESGFICPKCNQTLKTTSTFNRHVVGHNRSPRGRKEKRVKKDACLPPKTKLPKTFSESDIKTAQNTSNEIKTLTKPIATLAAAGGLEYTIQDQQKTLVLTEITNLTPIGLLSKQQSYYLLGSPNQVQEIYEKQPKVIFSIPPDLSHPPKHHETNDVLLTFLMKNSSMASLLKNETYHELNDLHLKKADSDWPTNQEARYAVSQMFAGCILLDGTKAILINCVEPYGRKKRIDPHYERYSKDDCNSSIPDSNCYHKQVCVKLFESDNSDKLVIGLFSCNLLVTSSCTLSNNPVICVGPSTNSFTPVMF